MPDILVDTDVLIEGLKDKGGFVKRLNTATRGGRRFVSVLNVAELRAGATGDDPEIDQMLLDFTVLSADLDMAEAGGCLRRKYMRSHGTGLVDAILAAITLANDLTLVTNNRKHFPMPNLTIG